jgi:hypothetical protein
MWLLNARTWLLEYFEGINIPRYAILSHRWVGEEVTFQDIKKGTGSSKGGYRKIEWACQQALCEDGLDSLGRPLAPLSYVWVDTCCIDKSSSAELSEAINSMYQWYQDAVICYAYLSDATSESKSTFENSVWFTRGWTLQELLAPSQLSFYDYRWTLIGDRLELRHTIARITNIPDRILERGLGLDLQSDVYCAAEKLSWAAQRRTTREEDRAYSLLGIFGVNMPLIYGEGKRAFQRLQEAIFRTSNDLSIFAWPSAPTVDSRSFFVPSPSHLDWAGTRIRKYHGPSLSLQMSPVQMSFRLMLLPWQRGPLSDLYVAPVCETGTDSKQWSILGIVFERHFDGQDYSYWFKNENYRTRLPLLTISPRDAGGRVRQVTLHPGLSFDNKPFARARLDEPAIAFRVLPIQASVEVLEHVRVTAFVEDGEHSHGSDCVLSLPAGTHGVAGCIRTQKPPTKTGMPLWNTLMFLGCDFDFNIFCLAVRYEQLDTIPEIPSISIPRLHIADICLESSADIMALVDELRRSTEDNIPLTVGNLCADGVELHLMASKKFLNWDPRFEITDTGVISFRFYQKRKYIDVQVDLSTHVPQNRHPKPRLIGKGKKDIWYPRTVT